MLATEKKKLIEALRMLMEVELGVRNLDARIKNAITETLGEVKRFKGEDPGLIKLGLEPTDYTGFKDVLKNMKSVEKLTSPAKGILKDIWANSAESKMDKSELADMKKKLATKTAKLEPIVQQADALKKSIKQHFPLAKVSPPNREAVLGYCGDVVSGMTKYKSAISKI